MVIQLKKHDRTSSRITYLLWIGMVLFSVLHSKTVYFGIINERPYRWVFYIIVVVTFLKSKTVSKYLVNNLIKAIILIVFLVLNLVINSGEMSSSQMNLVTGIIFNIFIVALMTSTITKKIFSLIYIRIMVVICLLSLGCLLIAIFDPNLAMKLSEADYNWTVRYGYSFFYTWGWNGVIFTRNSGPFWEPGAFQGFILIALLMLMYNTSEDGIKHTKSTAALLIITLLTTQSTTAYIIILLIFFTQLSKFRTFFKKLDKSIQLLFTGLISIVMIGLIIFSNNITLKLTGVTGGESSSIRFNDIFESINLIGKGNFIGLGETSIKTFYETMAGINQNSAGFLSMFYTYGIFFGTVYTLYMFKGLITFFKSKNLFDKFVVIIIFLILHLTEGLYWLPVYLIFIFQFTSRDSDFKVTHNKITKTN